VDFKLLPEKSRRAAFAKMRAAGKLSDTSTPKAPKKASAKKATVRTRVRKVNAPKPATPSSSTRSRGPVQGVSPAFKGGPADGSLSRDYLSGGAPSEADQQLLIDRYRLMHGKDPSPAMLAKLRRKRRPRS